MPTLEFPCSVPRVEQCPPKLLCRTTSRAVFGEPTQKAVQIIVWETGFSGCIIWDTTKPNGQRRRKLDTTRAEQTFGFCAKVDFLTGLHQTIAWYWEKHQNGEVP